MLGSEAKSSLLAYQNMIKTVIPLGWVFPTDWTYHKWILSKQGMSSCNIAYIYFDKNPVGWRISNFQ